MNAIQIEDIADIIKTIRDNGIRIVLNDGNLQLSTKKGVKIQSFLIELIRENKAAIIDYLQNGGGDPGEEQLSYDSWFDETSLMELELTEYFGGYDTMHQQEKEYMRFLIVGDFGYNLVLKFKFGTLDKAAIEWVFEQLFNRHESLRTTFMNLDGKTRQFIHTYPMKGFAIEYIDLVDEADKQNVIKEMLWTLAKLPFNFESGPLVNIRIVQLTADSNLLLFTLHHVISDEISLTILRNDLLALYEAYLNDKKNPLPPLSIQYKEYSKWIRNYLDNEKGARSRKFYADKIRDSLDKSNYDWGGGASYKDELDIELKDRLKVESIVYPFTNAYGLIVNINIEPGASYKTYLYGPQLVKLKRIAAENNSSLFTVLLAVLSILIKKVKDDSNLRFYIPFSSRVFEKFDHIVGWLVGEIIVCVDVPEDAAITEMIALAEREVNMTAYHRLYPHEYIMRDLDIPLNVLSPFHLNFVKKEGFISDFTPAHSSINGSHFDLKCGINSYENGMEFCIDYKLSKYTPEEVERLFIELTKLLNSVT